MQNKCTNITNESATFVPLSLSWHDSSADLRIIFFVQFLDQGEYSYPPSTERLFLSQICMNFYTPMAKANQSHVI